LTFTASTEQENRKEFELLQIEFCIEMTDGGTTQEQMLEQMLEKFRIEANNIFNEMKQLNERHLSTTDTYTDLVKSANEDSRLKKNMTNLEEMRKKHRDSTMLARIELFAAKQLELFAAKQLTDAQERKKRMKEWGASMFFIGHMLDADMAREKEKLMQDRANEVLQLKMKYIEERNAFLMTQQSSQSKIENDSAKFQNTLDSIANEMYFEEALDFAVSQQSQQPPKSEFEIEYAKVQVVFDIIRHQEFLERLRRL
jgi:hypothetical protein